MELLIIQQQDLVKYDIVFSVIILSNSISFWNLITYQVQKFVTLISLKMKSEDFQLAWMIAKQLLLSKKK